MVRFSSGTCALLPAVTGFLRWPRLEKSLNFRKLKKSLNCFGKRVEGLEKFGICLVKVSTRLGYCADFLP